MLTNGGHISHKVRFDTIKIIIRGKQRFIPNVLFLRDYSPPLVFALLSFVLT